MDIKCSQSWRNNNIWLVQQNHKYTMCKSLACCECNVDQVYLSVQMFMRYFYQRNPIQQDFSLNWIVKPFYQVRYCALQQRNVWGIVSTLTHSSNSGSTQVVSHIKWKIFEPSQYRNIFIRRNITFPPPLGPTRAIFEPDSSFSVMPWN